MIQISIDPINPERLVLSASTTIYLDRVLLATLHTSVEEAIREQAIKDLKKNKQVRKVISAAATAKLLKMLGVEEPAAEETPVSE